MLRLEDLDERCRRPEFKQGLIEDLHWLGIEWDAQPVVQTTRIHAYEDALDLLRDRVELYPCFCTRADLHVASAPHASDGSILYPGSCYELDADERARRSSSERHALRLHVPDRSISFDDAIQGTYTQNLVEDCGDFVVRRSDGVFAYQLACVVDDIFSDVTDVVRGSDLLSSTPRQMLLCELLDAEAPRYAHHPLLVASDGRRLSKRDGDLEIAALRERGVTAEDIVGFLAHHAGQSASPVPMKAQELAESFDLTSVPKRNVTVAAEDLVAQGFVA